MMAIAGAVMIDRRVLPLLLAAVLAILGGTPRDSRADHQFVDVPSGTFYHDAVDFLVDNGITFGCGPGRFCPAARPPAARWRRSCPASTT